MRTIYVNEIWTADKEVVRGFIIVQKTIDEAIETLFFKDFKKILTDLIMSDKTKKEGGFHFFTKFCQFIVFLNYNDKEVVILNEPHKIGVSIEVIYFGTSDNVNDTFDYMLKLRKSGWDESDRDKILEIASEIKKEKNKSHFEICELKIKDRYDALTSYL